jgi:hypothetical protein
MQQTMRLCVAMHRRISVERGGVNVNLEALWRLLMPDDLLTGLTRGGGKQKVRDGRKQKPGATSNRSGIRDAHKRGSQDV